MSRIEYDSVLAKRFLGEKLALKLGMAVEVVEGSVEAKAEAGPQGQGHVGAGSEFSGGRRSAREASKINELNDEWERFRNGESDD